MNADPLAPYRSEYVCNQLARKTVKSWGDEVAKANAAAFNEKLLLPVAKRLISSGRMPRGELGRMAQQLVRVLKTDKGVVDVEFDSFAKKLSANEEHRLAYILAVSDGIDWFDFVASEVRMKRKQLTSNVCVADVRMHRHALSRYMQRELKPAEHMLADIAEALHASVLLGTAAATVEGGNIAIPLNDGLLLGHVSIFEEPGTRMVLTLDKGGPEQSEEKRRSITSKLRPYVELLTYVDGHTLGPTKEAVRDMLIAFLAAHRVGAKATFDASYYTCSVVTEDYDRYMDKISAAINAACDLVKQPEWLAWADNRQ
jgi:hypothetical protein